MVRVLLIIITFVSISIQSYAQINSGTSSIFNLQPSPIISNNKINISVSYGLNIGNPSINMQQLEIPDGSRSILFNQTSVIASIGNRIELNYGYQRSYSRVFNTVYSGEIQLREITQFGIKWNAVESERLFPDFAVGLDLLHNETIGHAEIFPFSTSLGSQRMKFKYNLNIDWDFYYFIYPYRFSGGVGYEIFDKINLVSEVCYKTIWDGNFGNQSAFLGINFSNIDYIFINIGVFYFGYNFTDALPSRHGFDWQNQNNIISVKEQNNFFLLSGNFHINMGLF